LPLLEVHLEALRELLYPLLRALEPFAKTRGSGAQVNLQIGNRRHLARLPPLPSGKARGSCSPRLLKWSNELSPDTGAGLHRPGTFTAQQVVRCQHLPLLDVLAKGRRPVVDDPSRVSRQHFHLPVESALAALQRQPELMSGHRPELIQRDVMLPAQPLVLVVGDALPRGGAYASPSSSSPASSSSLGLISPAASRPSKILSM